MSEKRVITRSNYQRWSRFKKFLWSFPVNSRIMLNVQFFNSKKPSVNWGDTKSKWDSPEQLNLNLGHIPMFLRSVAAHVNRVQERIKCMRTTYKTTCTWRPGRNFFYLEIFYASTNLAHFALHDGKESYRTSKLAAAFSTPCVRQGSCSVSLQVVWRDTGSNSRPVVLNDVRSEKSGGTKKECRSVFF